MQINFKFTDNVYCIFVFILQCQKQLPICIKAAETLVILIVFNYVHYQVRVYIVTVSYSR